jgi:hypothetical protein
MFAVPGANGDEIKSWCAIIPMLKIDIVYASDLNADFNGINLSILCCRLNDKGKTKK